MPLPMRAKASGMTRSPDAMDDDDSHDDHPTKGSSSSQVRKAQNRIAQREFRLRKQQYVRDLEARVEVLSADKEDRVELMTLIIRNLLKENKDLRTMVRSMSTFVGEGMGSCLPRLGLNAAQLDAVLNRQDTETAHEAFVALKAAREAEADGSDLVPFGAPRRSSSHSKRKRSSTDDPTGSTEDSHPTKVPAPERNDSDDVPEPVESINPSSDFESFAYLFPGTTSSSIPAPNYTPYSAPPFTMPLTPNVLPYTPSNNSGFGLSGFGLTGPITPRLSSQDNQDTSAYLQDPVNGNQESERQRQLRAAVANLTGGELSRTVSDNSTPQQVMERRRMEEDLEKRMGGNEYDRQTEAYQLITYHINNYRLNHAYNLPASLRPTVIQRTAPHEHAIDNIIFPSIRDRMIVMRGQYDLVQVLHDILDEWTIHGEDVLDHHSWDISEKWLLANNMLVGDEVYEVVNHWRAQRGEPLLTRPPEETVVVGSR